MRGKCKNCEYRSDKCREIADAHKRDDREKQNTDATLCWCCKNAVPAKDGTGKYTAGCEWSMFRRPVKGWEVSKAALVRECGHTYMTYCVSRCPKFERG